MLVSGNFFHIILAKRQVRLKCGGSLCTAEHDLDQTVRRDHGTVRCCQILSGIQAKGHVLDLSCTSDPKDLILLQCLCKVNRHFLPLIIESGVRLCYRYFLSGIGQLHLMGFCIQHQTVRRCLFHNLVLAQVQFFCLCLAFLICGNGIHHIPGVCPHGSVRRHNVLGGDHFIYRPGLPGYCVNRRVNVLAFRKVPVFVHHTVSRHLHRGELFAGFCHKDLAFLRHILFFHRDHGHSAVLPGLFLRYCKWNRRTVQYIPVRSLHLYQCVISIRQYLRCDQITVTSGIESIQLCDFRIGILHGHKVPGFVIDLEPGSRKGDGVSRFCVFLDYFDIGFKQAVVDEVAVNFSVTADIHIKVSDHLPAFPAFCLVYRINAIRQVFRLGISVLITHQRIPLAVLCAVIAACAL